MPLTKSAGSRVTKSYTIEPEITRYVLYTKGEHSASERVNQLLKKAMVQEQYEQLERESADFFASALAGERMGTKAFRRAARRTLERD